MSTPNGNGHAHANGPLTVHGTPDLDVSKLKITLADSLKPVPPPEDLIFGNHVTDHMLIMSYDPVTGWSAPEIKPYGPLSIDPTSSCIQYANSLFEGMKAYLGPDGRARLFRPNLNMARIARSADRVSLPTFDTEALLALIKKLVIVERRWIPAAKGHSLYIRPTIIGTRNHLGVRASDSAMLYVVLSPTGPYFRTGAKPISLYTIGETVRAWPGGTGGHKLALNYTPTFKPQQAAEKLGYDQVLWLLGDKITEAGAMNFFVVVKRDDGDLDVITPPLDGTILPGVTRQSCLELVAAHPSRTVLPHLSPSLILHPQEKELTVTQLKEWSAQGRLLEAFAVGTAAIIAGVGRIGVDSTDIVLPAENMVGGRGPVARALYERIVDIQEGLADWEGWGVVCE